MHQALRSQSRYVVIALIAISCWQGCKKQDGPQRFAASGTVIYNGQPLPVGEVFFEPDPAAGNQGPGTVAEIKDGKFQLEAKYGHVGGPHILRVDGFDGVVNSPLNPKGKPYFSNKTISHDLPKKSSKVEIDITESGEAQLTVQ